MLFDLFQEIIKKQIYVIIHKISSLLSLGYYCWAFILCLFNQFSVTVYIYIKLNHSPMSLTGKKFIHDLIPYNIVVIVRLWLQVFMANSSSWVFHVLIKNHRCVVPIYIFIPINNGQKSSSLVFFFAKSYSLVMIYESWVIVRFHIMGVNTGYIILWSFVNLKLFNCRGQQTDSHRIF